jgi:predicted nucleic acid-binding protein
VFGRNSLLKGDFARRGSLVSPERLLRACSDPDDDKFPERANEARADCLVTRLGHGELAPFSEIWKATKVVSAREFVGPGGATLGFVKAVLTVSGAFC